MSRVPRGGRRRVQQQEQSKYENTLGDGHDNYYGDRVTPPPHVARRKTQAEKKEEQAAADDDWYWGRYRTGGGGAPLKDVNGNTVTNLRQVHRGTVEIDYSPGSPKKNKSPKSLSRQDDYDDDRYIPGLGQAANSPKKFMSALREITTGMSEDEIKIKVDKELAYKMELQKQIDERKRVKITEQRREAEQKRKDLEEYYRSFYKGNIPPDKLALLRKPIVIEGEEELLLKSHTRDRTDNRRPPVLNLSYRNEDGFEEDSEVIEPRRGARHAPPRMKRNDFEEQYDTDPKERRYMRDYDDSVDSGLNQRNGRGLINAEYEEDYEHDAPRRRQPRRTDDSTDEVNDDRDRRTRKSMDTRRRDDRDAEYVTKAEFDELSSLCGKLLKQQEELEEELQEKDSMLRRFKKGDASSGRASSIQKAGNSVVAAAPQRSKSVYSNQKADSKNQGGSKPKSATAFGRRAIAPPAKPEPKPKEAPKSFVEYAAQGLNRVPEKNKKGAVNKPMLGMGSRAGQDNSRAARREDRVPDSDVQSSVRGISKLYLGVQGNRGPVIVNHDDDYEVDRREPVAGGLKALQQKISKTKPSRFSMSDSNSELEGVSEHLYTRGSEDQLDKLLVQAKKTRAVGFENDY